MMRASALSCALLVALGCSSGANDASGHEPTGGEERAASRAEETSTPEPTEEEDAELAACVEECVLSRQMQATGIEIIREECRRECESGAQSN